MNPIKNTTNSKKLTLSTDAWSLLDDSRFEIIQINLNPGEIIEKHSNPLEVVFYVVEGQGKATIEDQSELLKKEDSIKIEKNLQRSWENTGENILKLLVYKIKQTI